MNGDVLVSPFPAIVEYDAIAPQLGEPIAEGGHSKVLTLEGAGEWLAKLFRTRSRNAEDGSRLDRLIALRHGLSALDRKLATRAISWPVARVVDHKYNTIGILMPAAPKRFDMETVTLRGHRRVRPLAIDWLAMPDAYCARRGMPIPSWRGRLTVCRDLLNVGALFARNDLIYGDWNYSNAFWSVSDYSAYVIDIDVCSFDVRPLVSTPNWEDPLSLSLTDSFTDRYRLALLVARCATGMRNTTASGDTFDVFLRRLGADHLASLVATALTTRRRTQRPSASELLEALEEELRRVAGSEDLPISKLVSRKTTAAASPQSIPGDANVASWRTSAQGHLPPEKTDNSRNQS
jgi:hypothetical protein